LQVLAVPHAAAPQRNVGSRLLTLERANDVRRAVSPIRGRFTNRDLIASSHAFQLREIRLVVMSCSSRHLRIQNDPTVGVDRLMHFILQLPRGSLLLSKRALGIGTTARRTV